MHITIMHTGDRYKTMSSNQTNKHWELPCPRSLGIHCTPLGQLIRVRDRLHVDETGKRRLLSLLKIITRSDINPTGGIDSAPVTNANICGSFIVAALGPQSSARCPPTFITYNVIPYIYTLTFCCPDVVLPVNSNRFFIFPVVGSLW